MAGDVRQIETLLKALADGTRLRILGLLTAGEVCVCDIQSSLRIPQPKASRHLAYLRRAGLVTTRRDGLWVHYGLARSIDPVVDTIRQAVVHALGHVDAVRKDATRLERETGCCAPQVSSPPAFACCETSSARTREVRARDARV